MLRGALGRGLGWFSLEKSSLERDSEMCFWPDPVLQSLPCWDVWRQARMSSQGTEPGQGSSWHRMREQGQTLMWPATVAAPAATPCFLSFPLLPSSN